ncbi:MAG: M28 family peptidase [Flavobacteriaceae bacterium]|nr:M28 family peptidase [Flavobacteriaceae bacterium]
MKLKYTKALSLLILIATIYYSFYSLLPSKISDINTPLTEFSTERALIHLKEITKKPHYVGTESHKNVREYLVLELEKLGLQVELQEQIAINNKWKAAVNTVNIIAKIEGSNKNSKALLLLLAHYDSAVHSSLGASDAGSGIVTILEGVRAFLANNKAPKNDVIVLFSDAEEIGLLGAVAFVNHHRWIKDVGLVLNFEARGSGGPSYMLLETNGGNKELIKAFNKAKPNFPVANSLMYSIYKMLPNDTDLTIFREDANINGFNFAFIDDHFDYHTAQDTYERLDRNTLEQQGDYLMTLLPYFANSNLENLDATSDDVYFSFPKIGLVTYPFSWVLPSFIVAVILFFILIFIGVSRKKLTIKEMLIGFVPFLGSLIISALVAVFGWKLLKQIYPQYNDILHGFTYNGHWYIVAFAILALAISSWIYKRYFNKYSSENLIVAPIFIWIIINFLIVLKLQGAGFFIFPVFLALISLMVLLSSNTSENKTITIALLSIPLLIVFAPLVKMFPVGLGLKMLGVSAVFVVLLFGLLLPIFYQYKSIKKLHLLFLMIAIFLFTKASFQSDYSEDRKQPTSLIYVLDTDKKEAFWASYESKVNNYNKAYLTDDPAKGSFVKSATASKYYSKYKLHKKTEVVDLKQPITTILLDSIEGENRHIKLRIETLRNANRVELIAKDSIVFNSFIVNGEALKRPKNQLYAFDTGKRKNVLSYYYTKPNEVIELEYVISSKVNPTLEIREVKYDLFTNQLLKVTPRKDSKMMPTPFVINDATIVKKEIRF